MAAIDCSLMIMMYVVLSITGEMAHGINKYEV